MSAPSGDTIFFSSWSSSFAFWYVLFFDKGSGSSGVERSLILTSFHDKQEMSKQVMHTTDATCIAGNIIDINSVLASVLILVFSRY